MKALKKRGRPAKVKVEDKISLEEQLDVWDEIEAFNFAEETQGVNWEHLCKELQNALAKSYVEAEDLEKKIKSLNGEIAARDIIITYLEKRRYENVAV